MQLIKKILFITLTVSCGSSNSMDHPEFSMQPACNPELFNQRAIYHFGLDTSVTYENQAKKLATFARNYQQGNDTANAFFVAQWLVQQQKDIVKTESWIEFMNTFLYFLSGNYSLGECIENKKLDIAIQAIKETVYKNLLNDNYPALLVDRMLVELNNVT